MLLNYPFTDDSGAKVRPALIVSTEAFNAGEDVILVPISSASDSTDKHAFPIVVTEAFFPQTGLRKTSSVKWTKPLTISKKMIMRRLGSLERAPLIEIQARIQSIFHSQ